MWSSVAEANLVLAGSACCVFIDALLYALVVMFICSKQFSQVLSVYCILLILVSFS